MIERKPNANTQAVKVTFQLPADMAKQRVAIVGDFNGWDASKDLMKRDKKSGDWRKTLTFAPGAEVRFRYCIDDAEWCNDETADRFEPNGFGSENGVLIV